jgi:UDP-N-acetylmuramyl tripeptide synthase
MFHSILLGKGVLKLSKVLSLGAGSTWPGHAALKADANLIRKVINKNPDIKIVFVAGTNGKTTTTKALSHILESSNISVLTNMAGANLLNGLASLLVKHINLSGKLNHKALLFEVDENSLPLVLEEIPNPDGIILLNLFRDQLDRYGEVNSTAEKWRENLKKLDDKTLVVANADDPQVAYVAGFAKNKKYFTISDKLKTEKELSHAVDSTTCPKCNNSLVYSGISYSHLGNYKCPNCGFKNPDAINYEFKTSLFGNYNRYNLSSVVLSAKELFGINSEIAIQSLQNFKPAFGRQEVLDIDGKKVMLLLSKNPTGFNESLKVVLDNKSSSLLLLLNDRVPDGRDISWIWDVDFEVLTERENKIFVSGDRCYDLANRLMFAGVSHVVFENYEMAYKESLAKTQNGRTLTILPTYSAMLEVRKLISGKAIL